MKAQEFRLGNYYEYNCGDEIEDWTLAEIDADDLDYLSRNPDDRDFRTIPITEELLLKFGLGKNDGYPYKFLNGFIKIRNGIYFFKYYDLEVELPFVHSLQNLYFALKGEELTFKK
jgi:hypothetical protein